MGELDPLTDLQRTVGVEFVQPLKIGNGQAYPEGRDLGQRVSALYDGME